MFIDPHRLLTQKTSRYYFILTGVLSAACLGSAPAHTAPANATPQLTGCTMSVDDCIPTPPPLPPSTTPTNYSGNPGIPPSPPAPGGDTSPPSVPTIVFDPTSPYTGPGPGGTTAGGTTLGNLAPAAGGNLGDLSPSAGGDMLGELSPSAGGIGANVITCVNNLLQRDWDNPSASYDCNTATN